MSERIEAIEAIKENLRTPRRLISENRESVIVYKDELEVLLAYVEVLEEVVEAVEGQPDTESDLEVEDEVESLINALDVPKGSRGTVYRIDDTGREEYPIQINYEGRKYPVGYKRDELGRFKA